MAETSEGWDGTVNEAAMARILAAAAPPRIEDGFLLEVVAGQRRVILSAGETHHGFIRYITSDPKIIDLPTPSSGGRWYLIAQRRDWAENTVTIVTLPADATDSNGGPVPSSYPADFVDTPGVAADFPLYWVWVRSTDTQLRYRRAILKERAFGRSALAEWGVKSGPNQHVGAPGGANANSWYRGYDSGGSIDATIYPLGILIGEDAIYEAVAKQRGNGSNPGSAYITLGINGNRQALEDRPGGAWFHDHSSTNYTSSESRYVGPLARGEIVTAGPPAGMGSALYYGSSGLYGGIWIRRLS